MPFSKAQREWILARDEHRCWFPEAHDCYGQLEIHHIVCQRWSEKVLHQVPDQFDTPDNALTVCQYAHQEYIHADMAKALEAYRLGRKEAFKDSFKVRDWFLSQGVHYWNDCWDEEMEEIAIERTALAVVRFGPFPTKGGKKC